MQTKLSFYLNEVFKYVVLFLLFFVWVNFYYPNFLASVAIAILLAAASSYLLTTLFYKKKNKTEATNQDKKNCKNASTQLVFYDLNETISFFSSVFTAKNISHKTTNFGIILYPSTPECALFLPVYSSEEITESIVINAYKQTTLLNAKRCLLCGVKFSTNAQNLAKNIQTVSMVLYGEQETYFNLLKPTNCFPQTKITFKHSGKVTPVIFLQLLINKQNTKHYFYGSLFMLFASMFLPMTTYYVIFSSILLLLSLASFYSDQLFYPNKQYPVFKN